MKAKDITDWRGWLNPERNDDDEDHNHDDDDDDAWRVSQIFNGLVK